MIFLLIIEKTELANGVSGEKGFLTSEELERGGGRASGGARDAIQPVDRVEIRLAFQLHR